jgi:CRISPR system Cascade subunit CasE
MHLTRLNLNSQHWQARRDLSDAYEMHRSLSRAFVADAASKPARFLWRLESAGSSAAGPMVLIQSEGAPNWTALTSLPNYLARAPEVKEFAMEPLVDLQSRYRFRLLANPTVTRDGKRLGLVGNDAQLAWLARQGERHGFAIEAARVDTTDTMGSRKGDQRISLRRACFDGFLRVDNTALLIQAIQLGIGPGKAFGCGMLSIARC